MAEDFSVITTLNIDTVFYRPPVLASHKWYKTGGGVLVGHLVDEYFFLGVTLLLKKEIVGLIENNALEFKKQ